MIDKYRLIQAALEQSTQRQHGNGWCLNADEKCSRQSSKCLGIGSQSLEQSLDGVAEERAL